MTAVRIASLHDLSAEFDGRNPEWLTRDELIRYQAITSGNRKMQFLTGHFLVRKMAANIFNHSFADWIYFTDDEKHRRLKCRQDGFPLLYCSISHSGDWVAAAVSDMPIGIDIETFDKQRDFIAIAKHVFSDAEVSRLEKCDTQELKKEFYLHWTLKECIAKQFGHGLKFEVSRSHRPVQISDSSAASLHSWQYRDYVCSIACNTENKIDTGDFPEETIYKRWRNIPVNQHS